MCCNVIPFTYSNLPCISHISVFSQKGNPRPPKDEPKYHRWLNLSAGSQIVDENLHGYLWMHASTVSSIHQAWVSMIEGVPTRMLTYPCQLSTDFSTVSWEGPQPLFLFMPHFHILVANKKLSATDKAFCWKNKCAHYEGEIWDLHIQTLGYSMLPNYIAQLLNFSTSLSVTLATCKVFLWRITNTPAVHITNLKEKALPLSVD